ncbi:hypothetical protein [Entomomonas asaccharolytica]|uniref:Uncharacterized protein n=1 Tax=Entomomonas asaccharolytica TaxID=2785331 RepID=A0A974NHX4_9GAMM|nr:hypothetical protein [Entomomonas asaccharolytica]QQP86920.1 hypothetical protein JHT90_06660 [Entomomonas asaccharolytica]
MDKKIQETLKELITAKQKTYELENKLRELCLPYYEFETLDDWGGWDSLIDDIWIEGNENPFLEFDKAIKFAIKKYYEE